MDQIKEYAPDDPMGLQLCTEALELYRGHFLACSKNAPWLMDQRSHYREAYCSLVHSTLERSKILRTDDVLPLLCRRSAAIIPEDEAFHRELIRHLMDRKQGSVLIGYLYQLAMNRKANWLVGEEEQSDGEHFKEEE